MVKHIQRAQQFLNGDTIEWPSLECSLCVLEGSGNGGEDGM